MTTPIAWVAHCPRCGRRVTVSTTGRVETHYVARYSARWPLGSAVAACPGSDTVHPQFRGPTADQADQADQAEPLVRPAPPLTPHSSPLTPDR